MGAVNERVTRGIFPGAGVVINGDVDSGDCEQYPSFQQVVLALQCTEDKPTTIRGGIAYTEATTTQIANYCVIP